MKIDHEIAKKLVLDLINRSYTTPDDELVIVNERTIEKEYGWYFIYNSKKYLDSGDYRFQLAGNGPILVTKQQGEIVRFGTAHAPEDYIQLYERANGKF